MEKQCARSFRDDARDATLPIALIAEPYMRRLIVSAAIVLCAALAAWSYFSPQLTLHAMQRAAERGDAGALSEHIDFPALRNDLKAQFSAAASRRIGGDGSGGLRDFGAALAAAAASPAIDALISESSLMLMFAGRDAAGLGQAASVAAAPETPAAKGAERRTSLRRPNASMGYQDFSTYTVTFDLNHDPDLPATLVFKRHRLFGWKLAGIDLSSAELSAADLVAIAQSR
jgi:Protein of unknown function (DUF2939)